ncbi:hypothetical protein ACFYO1_02570 [Nocardia sp. NPDC006044]|uniref:hypothetical protein n=1 Tax=Nocardia sp. NPDC006044 TaxID=3364306 RepID=UPI00369F255C
MIAVGPKVRGVAQNPAAPATVLLSILQAGRMGAFWVLGRTDLPDVVYDAIVADPNPNVRNELAEGWYAPGAQRARLRADPNVRIRRRVAEGPNTFRQPVDPLPDLAYAELIDDPYAHVRSAAVTRWPSPVVDLVDRLLDDPDPRVRAAAAARSWKRKPHLLREIVHTPDDLLWMWREALPTGRFEPDAIANLRRRSPRYQAWLAENPYLPGNVVAQLAADSNPAVRLAVSMRYDLTDSARRTIDYRVRPTDRITPAFWAQTTDDTEKMRRAACSDHVGLRRSVACNRGLPQELVDHLAGDDDFAVRLLLCENRPDAPSELLWRTFFEARVITRWALLDHPNFPTGRFGAFAENDDPEQRCLAVRDRTVSAEVVDHLSRDPAPRVRGSVAADPRLGRQRVLELLHDDPEQVAVGAAQNPNLPVEAMQGIVAESDSMP